MLETRRSKEGKLWSELHKDKPIDW